MEALDRFFNWFNRMGGEIPRDSEYLKDKFHDTKPLAHSLKGRAEEIKRKYNHKFKHVDFLKDVPDINNLKFDKLC